MNEYYSGDQIKDIEMSGAVGMWRGEGSAHRVLVGKNMMLGRKVSYLAQDRDKLL
jgi:hypothetical protein